MAVATWVTGARVRTLPAAVAPVAVGTAVAHNEDQAVWWKAALALVVALALQVGTNYANDFSDGIRGTDDHRVGPVRLVASGLAAPAAVKRAAYLSFGVAAGAGFVLAATTAWWLLLVGAAAIASGWLYTGGPKPYGYAGLGELSVFVFFGLVSVAGTAFVQTEQLTRLAFAAGVPMGLVACALLVINNLRDIETDRAAGKLTLAVRIGNRGTRLLYGALLLTAAIVGCGISITSGPNLIAALFGLLLAWAWILGRRVREGVAGPGLIGLLGDTSKYQIAVASAIILTLALSR